MENFKRTTKTLD